MEAKAITRYLRISPRKLRLVIDTVRSKPVSTALSILEHLNKKGARMVTKTLKSAQANAKVKKMDEARLYVQQIKADGGPVMKRYMSRSMGRADVILKRMAHLTIVLGERERPVSAVKAEPEAGKEKGSKIFGRKKTKQAAGVGA
ncbi:MAG: 50S ribosomal protein L22 [Candidatus Omnitrophica bacterium]|nr:50S ribosomal protein L22 [Candidatus Omnitrophota bacterium]